jgi:hypothetical protein
MEGTLVSLNVRSFDLKFRSERGKKRSSLKGSKAALVENCALLVLFGSTITKLLHLRL